MGQKDIIWATSGPNLCQIWAKSGPNLAQTANFEKKETPTFARSTFLKVIITVKLLKPTPVKKWAKIGPSWAKIGQKFVYPTSIQMNNMG